MRPFKVLLFFTVFTAILFVVLYFAQGLINQDFFSFLSGSDNNTQDKKNNSTSIQGITLNSLNQPNLDGDITLYLNGTKEPQVVDYRLATGRQNILAKLTGSDPNSYAPGGIVIKDNSLYWVRARNQTSQLIRVDTQNSNRESEVLYTNKNGAEIIGIKVFSGNEIYFTEYSQNENDGFDYQIIKYNGVKTETVLKETAQKIKVVAGKDVDTAKGQLILQEYDDVTNSINGNCFYVKGLKQVGCEKISGVDYVITTREPDDQGFIMGGQGFIKTTDKKGVEKTILIGNKDEQFDSPVYKAGYVYFISGPIQAESASATDNSGTGDTNSYGTFQPVALERIKIDGTAREKLKVLPSSLFADINFATNDFLIVSLSQLSSDKLQTQPTNLWVLNLSNKDMKQLTDIKCDTEEFCEAVFLGSGN